MPRHTDTATTWLHCLRALLKTKDIPACHARFPSTRPQGCNASKVLEQPLCITQQSQQKRQLQRPSCRSAASEAAHVIWSPTHISKHSRTHKRQEPPLCTHARFCNTGCKGSALCSQHTPPRARAGSTCNQTNPQARRAYCMQAAHRTSPRLLTAARPLAHHPLPLGQAANSCRRRL